ncbi:MAG TPA: dihydrolipoamide acetyltransferase family protein [Gaiellaceae bacterium]|jgi:pyruvate dehydrogenase E2 component (dihydrolipoamide acetyltransferase)
MPYEFKLPDLGEGLTEGEIARWLVSEGDEIAEDQPLVEISTDKTTVEIPSPSGGKVTRILVGEGEVVPVGTLLVVIGGDGEPEQPAKRGAQATPAVRGVAKALGVDLDSVTGTGPDGRITEADVRGAAPGSAEGRRVPVRGVRRAIVEHLSRAHREIPAVTYVEECDFSGVELPMLLPTVLASAARTLKSFPELNARLDRDEILLLDRYDIGIAVQTGDGLLVPVVRAADTLSLDELRVEVDRLADGARDGTLAPEELRGSTFTVTSAGKLSGLLVTPLINHPEVAILGVHRVAPRPVVLDGEIVVRPIGNISLTFDHRVVDGARAAEFTLALIQAIRS